MKEEVQDDLKEAIAEIVFGKHDAYYTTGKCMHFGQSNATFSRFGA